MSVTTFSTRTIPGGVAIDAREVLLALAEQQPLWAEILKVVANSEELENVELAVGLSS